MVQLGIMATTFDRPNLEATLDAVAAHGVHTVQFDLARAAGQTLPEHIDAAVCARVRDALAARGISMAAVSGTFNMIDPDLDRRREGLRRLRTLAGACAALGTSVITLCTGTRDAQNMWRRH